MKFTQQHRRNQITAKARLRMARVPLNEPAGSVAFTPRKQSARFTIQIRDHAVGDSLTLNLHHSPWPNRWLCSHGEFSSAKIGRAIASMLAGGTLLLMLVAGCSWDPITPAHRPYENRRNPYTNGLSIDPRGVSDIEPVTVGVTNTWEMYSVKGPFNEVEWLILPSTPPSLKWQGEQNKSYRVIVSQDGVNWKVNSFTKVWRKQFWTEWEVRVPKPTNAFWKVITP